MATDVEIASNALLLIGDNPITAFSDPGAGAEAASDFYEITKNEVLCYHPWTFAMKSYRLDWLTEYVYVAGDYVVNGAIGVQKSYICILAHTSGDADDEPGVGAATTTYWTVDRASIKADPLINYSYAYSLPSTVLRLWYLKPIGTNYEMEGQLIYTNATQLLAGYVWSMDESNMPDYFITALEYKLAAKFAQSVTESASLAQEMNDLYLLHVSKASTIDSQSHPNLPIFSRPFTDARLNGYVNSMWGW